MRSDVKGVSTCQKGQENFEKFYSATVRGYRYQYEYRTFDGKLYGCVGKSLEDCRARVQQMISNASK
jgi:predicted transcriptional regulator